MTDWYVYILRCADETLYAGITIDPLRRLAEHNHNNRLGARYTRARRPVTLVYQEQCASRAQAAVREYEIKCLPRRDKERLVKSRKNRPPRKKTQSRNSA